MWYLFLRRSLACFLACSTGASKSFMYYVSDGVYGSFNCLLYDHATVEPEVVEVGIINLQDLYNGTSWLWSHCAL